MRWWRSPLLHFLAGGAVLFWLVPGGAPEHVPDAGPPEPVVVTAADVARLRLDYVRETGLTPTAVDERVLVERAVEEELLYREAIARGLDRNDRSVRTWLVGQMQVLADDAPTDPDVLYEGARALGLDRTDLVVRRILVQKMRLLAARTDETPPDAAVLRAFYARIQDEYLPPPRLDLSHVFFATATHGAGATAAAMRRLDALRRRPEAPVDAVRGGDAFTVGPHLVGQSPAQLAKLFGPAFAAAVVDAEPHTWVGPVPSAYGAHLVWVAARATPALPPFEAVAERVRERWQHEQRAVRLARLLDELKQRYPVRVETAAATTRSAS